ncbi:hypothetical protein F4009_12040 [Candidatus Poribacteria bacterium]|nr:hypothetical protein [Candidatus Poribacteria bacterium]MYH81611.1 hypothetical protein [Candidatus Poribacteria bacterium]MYK94704.1 hypothetical protein [Candidatus Poribacteria bacterium]
MFVPVKTKDGQHLMPTHAARARKLVKRGEATPYFNNGIYCIRLNKEPSDRDTQEIAVGVDPGSKKEGFTVKSAAHTYFNVQADAHNQVGKKVAKRRELRRSRRSRKCPNRKQRTNRLANKVRIPAGTRARWDWKLRILDWFSKLFPVTHVCVEDIKARTIADAKKWNTSFSPLEVGKQWFYSEVCKKWELLTLQGYETKEIRDKLGLKKSSKKSSEGFEAHCVDSWCLAHYTVGGDSSVDNTEVMCISPIPIARRNLHREQYKKGGIRSRYGGTVLCEGLVKNTLVKHITYGLTRLAGINAKGLFALYSLDGKRLTTSAKRMDFKVLRKLNFNYRIGHASPS